MRNNLVVSFLETLRAVRTLMLKRVYLLGQRKPWTIGYSEYKYSFIRQMLDGSGVSQFTDGALPPSYGYRMDERCVEYPWFFSRLMNDQQVVLDAGSVLNHREILSCDKLKQKQLYIATLYFEGRPHILPSPSYLYEDLRAMSFKDSLFDAVCCLSTLEHVGLDNTKLYCPDDAVAENDKYSHLSAVTEMRRVLKPGGTLYLTLPYGIYKNHGWFQVFDAEMIQRVVDAFMPDKLTKTFFRYDNEQWNFSSEENCQDGYCFDIHATKEYEPDYLAFSRCVVCLELVK